MKKIHLLTLLLVGLFFVQCAEKYPKTVERPATGLRNTQSIEIAKVELTDSATVVHIDAFFRGSSWMWMDSATYIQANDVKYPAISSNGVNLNEKILPPKGGELHFTITFPSLPKGTKSFDFIESDCDNCFKIWDVDLTGKGINYKPQIASVKIDEKADFPEPIFKTAKTKITAHISGLKEGFVLGDVKLNVNNIYTGSSQDIEGEKTSEGTYNFETELYSTSSAFFVIANKIYGFYLTPGEDIEFYLDLTAESIKKSRYNPQPDMNAIAFKGGLADINTQIATLDYTNLKVDIIGKPDSTILEMSKEEYFDFCLKKYDDLVNGLDTLGLTVVQRKFAKGEINISLIRAFQSMSSLYSYLYRTKNKIEWGTKIDYEAPKFETSDLKLLKKINYNDADWIYSSLYSAMGFVLRPDVDAEIITEIAGYDKGLLHDLQIAQPLIRKATSMESLTADEEQKLASLSSPYYAEVYKSIFDETKRKYDEAVAKGGFEIIETPQVAADKILDAIIANYKGKAVFVDFWATWCGPCLNAMKTIKPIKPEMKDKGVVSIYISNSSSPKVKWTSMLSEIGGIHYYLNDKEWKALSSKYKVQGIPTYMIFDKQGKQAYRSTGYPGNDKIKEELAKVW